MRTARGSESINESKFSLMQFVDDLLKDFFINDEGSLVGKLTKLPAKDNRQAVSQWLVQIAPWLTYRPPTDTERHRLMSDFGSTVRFLFL